MPATQQPVPVNITPDYVWPPKSVTVLDYAYCIMMRDMVANAIQAALKSGVAEYHVGSRGLKRYGLAELQSMLEYWIARANDALAGGSSMKCKRGVPCDV
jgi:hypothetical protein